MRHQLGYVWVGGWGNTGGGWRGCTRARDGLEVVGGFS
jgi:hypothetical protein